MKNWHEHLSSNGSSIVYGDLAVVSVLDHQSHINLKCIPKGGYMALAGSTINE